MIDLSTIDHHIAIKECVDLICTKTQNKNRSFYNTLVAYYLCKMASCMRVHIQTEFQGNIPVNAYVINLGSSGTGKGYSVNILENDIISGFKKRFVEDTFEAIALKHLDKLAKIKANKTNKSYDEEYSYYEKAYERAGKYLFTFDSGTAPAVKQIRNKLLLSGSGSINFQCDEIGSNLLSSTEVLNLFLELFDQGIVKQKLVKNTADNIRDEDMDGKTPANMLLFGTQAKLFDGGTIEDCFYSFLQTGFARRCLFGYNQTSEEKAYNIYSASEIYDQLSNPKNEIIITKWKSIFEHLADQALYNKIIKLNRNEGIKLIEYRNICEKLADSLPEHEEIKIAELRHRYFKTLKLAGAFAFIDKSDVITETQLNQAIKLVEESGDAFNIILNREKPYVKLAKYIRDTNCAVTHADLTEALPFYKSSSTLRNELMNLAIGWGYKNNILIKKSFENGIEFFEGESLEETDINNVIFSISTCKDANGNTNYAVGFKPKNLKFSKLVKLGSLEDAHFCNHHFIDNYRSSEKVINKFNLIIVDCDGELPIKVAKDFFKDTAFILYTTARHMIPDPDIGICKERFRLIIPMKYTLNLNKEEYKEFMNNVLKDLPFKSDEAANQISKKWVTYDSNNRPNGEVYYNSGDLLDVRKYIPRTSKNDQYKKEYQKIQNLDNLERWFLPKIVEGDRNNQLIKYALALVDMGYDSISVKDKVKSLNNQLSDKLSDEELENSIFITVDKRSKHE